MRGEGFFPQALNVIAGGGRGGGCACQRPSPQSWLWDDCKENDSLSSQDCNLPERDREAVAWGKKQAFLEQKGRWRVPKLGVKGSPLCGEG